MHYMRLIASLFVVAAGCRAAPGTISSVTPKHNVLFIVIDDLRPQLGAYGLTKMVTPNIDRLAEEGVLFEHAYVQQAICAPSRNSFLSGRYPDKTQVWNFFDNFRNSTPAGEEWQALPEFFRLNGYFTTGAGKVYHSGNDPPQFDDARSWSEPWPGEYGVCSCVDENDSPHATCDTLNQSAIVCQDDTIVSTVLAQLERLGPSSKPWLVAAGLHKPHLPFYAEQADFDLYDGVYAEPEHPDVPEGMPYVAWHSCLSNAAGNESNWGNFSDIPNNMTFETPMTPSSTAHLRKGYMGSVTYTDRNIGKLLAAVEPYKNNTVVVLVGDHGWSLGGQNLWCKMTTEENGVRIPLIIRTPADEQAPAGTRVKSMAEINDLYRTMADLAGLDTAAIQDSVDGISLAPLVRSTTAKPVREYARSQFPRCYKAIDDAQLTERFPLPALDRTDCQNIDRTKFDLMGYSVRSQDYRLTEWRNWNGTTLAADSWDTLPNATELYDHTKEDPDKPFATESVNVANDPAYGKIKQELHEVLRSLFDKPSSAEKPVYVKA